MLLRFDVAGRHAAAATCRHLCAMPFYAVTPPFAAAMTLDAAAALLSAIDMPATLMPMLERAVSPCCFRCFTLMRG